MRISRLAPIDWGRIDDELDPTGAAVLGQLLSREECREMVATYDDDRQSAAASSSRGILSDRASTIAEGGDRRLRPLF